MQTHNVGFIKNSLHVAFANEVVGIVGFVFVVSNYIRTKTFEHTCKSAAHIAIANNRHRFTFDLCAAVFFAQPNALPHFPIGNAQPVHQHQQHSYGMFAYCIAVAFGRIQAGDTHGFGVSHIYIFHPRSYPADKFQLSCSVEHLRIQLYLAADDDPKILMDNSQIIVAGIFFKIIALVAHPRKLFGKNRMRRINKKYFSWCHRKMKF